MIRYGLNGATVMPLDLASEIRLASAAGFDLIEFRAPKIEKSLQTSSLDELKTLLRAAGLQPLSVNALEQSNTRSPAEVSAEFEKLAGWAEALGCSFVVAVPGFLSAPVPKEEVVARTVDALAPLAEIAAAHNVRLGFEFLGFSNCTVNSLAQAREILRRLASPHVGLALDTFHFYLAGEPLEELGELEPGELILLHVNDAESRSRDELRDEHRLLPGQGVIPLQDMWRLLRERDLVDHASLELFRPEYWEQPPEPFLREALACLRRVFP